MSTLIAKLGATGDVVRTSSLLQRLPGEISWLTEAKNTVLLQGVRHDLRCYSWEDREQLRDRAYDLVINLEDTADVAGFLKSVESKQLFGAYLGTDDSLRYTDDSRGWFDLSLISRFGRYQADDLKLKNRRTYQDLVFEGLGLRFDNEPYVLPRPAPTDLKGDVAIAAEAGPVWPMKNWAYYDRIKTLLEERGLTVNVLPKRPSLLEHLGDVQNHRCLLGGDSLPMHFALGSGTRCVTIFNCTSPWEICDYGLQIKIVSPLLEEFFYKRAFDPRATTAIDIDEVLPAVMVQLNSAP
jgi:ADP-heptose:LPS heptosyltransferase